MIASANGHEQMVDSPVAAEVFRVRDSFVTAVQDRSDDERDAEQQTDGNSINS